MKHGYMSELGTPRLARPPPRVLFAHMYSSPQESIVSWFVFLYKSLKSLKNTLKLKKMS